MMRSLLSITSSSRPLIFWPVSGQHSSLTHSKRVPEESHVTRPLEIVPHRLIPEQIGAAIGNCIGVAAPHADGSEFVEAGERVIALGSYSGRARRTGKRFTARFAHVWTLQDGKIVRLQQCADTVQLARALAD